MSMSTVDQQQQARRYRTVAELVARERAGFSAHRVQEPATPRALTPVAELLRREGFDFGGDNARTVRLPAVTPAAPAASEVAANEAEPAESRRSRAAAIGSAAALFGLTIAGFLAIKPTVDPGLLPGSGDPGGRAGNPPPFERQIAQNTTQLNRGTALTADSDDAPSGPNAALRSTSTPAAPTSTPVAVAPAQDEAQPPADGGTSTVTSTAPPDDGQTTKQPKPPADSGGGTDPGPGDGDRPGEDDSLVGTVDGLLDPVEDAVAPMPDPVVGTVSGLLG